MKSVFIAEDHAFTAIGMRDAIEFVGGLEVVGIASNGIDAISGIKTLQPDCAVLDFSMPGASGVEVFMEGKRWSPNTRFVIITGFSLAATFRELVENGIDGLFMKNAPADEICNGIKAVAEGRRVIAPEAQKLIDSSGKTEKLTGRELEVLHAIARGASNSQMAEQFSISPKTIDSHRTSLMRKMGVHSTASLLVRAMRDGLIDVSASEHPPHSPASSS